MKNLLYVSSAHIFSLTSDEINKQIKTDNAIGSYILYNLALNKDSFHVPKYIGRSDRDLKERLKDHIGNYGYFSYLLIKTPYEAYKSELANYLKFKDQLDNKEKPSKPEGYGK